MNNDQSNLSKRQLAIYGGEPYFPDGPPVWPFANPEVELAVRKALHDGSWGKYDAQWTSKLAEQLKAWLPTENVLLCSSGTFATELALRGLGVGPGDEVILAGYDFPGNFRCIEAVGATPVLVDIAPGQWILDIDKVPEALSQKTKAVIASHLHGQFVDISALKAICSTSGASVLEDACQNPGATCAGVRSGTQGDVATFSFGGSKLLTCGRGGAVVTSRADIAQRIRIFTDRGNNAFPLSQLQAAVLLPQLKQIDQCNEQRYANVRHLISETKALPIFDEMFVPKENDLPAFYKLPWLIADAVDRDELSAAFQAEGIAMDFGFRGFAKRTSRRCRVSGTLNNAIRAADKTLVLHHPVLLKTELISSLAEAFKTISASFANR